jgi:peroxiredoxin
MIPHERSLVKKLAGKPFALIGVNSDPKRDETKERLVKEDMTWRHFWDQDTSGPIAKAWNVHGWPTTYVIDQDGIIRFRDLRDEQAEKAIEELLAKLPAKQDAKKGDAKKGE